VSFDHAKWWPRDYSMGVPIGSDWQDKAADDPVFGPYRTCGFWSEGETEFLIRIVRQLPSLWLEIGAHTGWCTKQIALQATKKGNDIFVVGLEPMFRAIGWEQRFRDNIGKDLFRLVAPWGIDSATYFGPNVCSRGPFSGCLIDGDHEGKAPLNDAIGCYKDLQERGVILLHDFRGPPVWDAAKWLVDQGMRWRVYPSVHMIFCAWRGEFDPPPDIDEGGVDWAKHWPMPEWAR
jgi:hypothetical protein